MAAVPQAIIFSKEIIEGAYVATWAVPVLHFTSGLVFLQYGHFYYQHASRKSRLLFRLGTIAISLHLGQVLVDFWALIQSLQSYLNGAQYSWFLYEALQNAPLAIIVLIVQYHFSRLAYATAALSSKWVVLLRILSLGTCIGGFGTAILCAKHFYRGGFDASALMVIHNDLLALYITWLGGNGLIDGTITLAMAKKFYRGRTSVRHRTLRDALGRLLNVIVNNFSLTFTISLLSLLAVLMPRVIPNITVKAGVFFQCAAFLLNGLLSRIYITSFFYSFEEPSYSSKTIDSCVASMGLAAGDRNHRSDSLVLLQLQAPKKQGQRIVLKRARVQVIREVEIKVENIGKNCFNDTDRNYGRSSVKIFSNLEA